MEYKNSIGGWITDTFGKSKSRQEVETLTSLVNQPVTISPLVYIIPLVAVGIFGAIYLLVLTRRS